MQILHQKHSKNYDLRPETRYPIKYIILHYTEMTFDDAIEKLCDPTSKVSAHYIIHENGSVYQLVGDFYRAWHAGKSFWKGEEKLNNNSIGIEIDNCGQKPFSEVQMNAVIALCKILMKKYNIPNYNVIGHSDIAPDRKIDPGIFFDWHLLAHNGVGIPFYFNKERSFNILDIKKNELILIQNKLKKIGYNIEKTGIFDKQTSDAFRAFDLHFNQSAVLAQGNLDYLFNLENNFSWSLESDKILSLISS